VILATVFTARDPAALSSADSAPTVTGDRYGVVADPGAQAAVSGTGSAGPTSAGHRSSHRYKHRRGGGRVRGRIMTPGRDDPDVAVLAGHQITVHGRAWGVPYNHVFWLLSAPDTGTTMFPVSARPTTDHSGWWSAALTPPQTGPAGGLALVVVDADPACAETLAAAADGPARGLAVLPAGCGEVDRVDLRLTVVAS
jgi:hypothetical protein